MTTAERLHRALCRLGWHLWGKARKGGRQKCRVCPKRRKVMTATEALDIATSEMERVTGIRTIDFDDVRRSRKLQPDDFPLIEE